ncbi:MAG: leucine-rich repeat protein [Paludibacteraceae bacterium]|nr:leucine-rich repeat protein [Paludibacteraceae bacterium]
MKRISFFLVLIALIISANTPPAKLSAATSYSLSTDNKTLTITGTGAMTNYTSSNYTDRPWNSYATTITKIVISSGVTAIGDYAFQGMTAVSEIEYEADVTVNSIGNYSFYGCSGLTSIDIPSSVVTIGERAYRGCNNVAINSVTIPESIAALGDQAFRETNIILVYWNARRCNGPTISTSYGYLTNPFYGVLENITDFIFGENVEVIPTYLCYQMTGITEVVIPSEVISIGNFAFSGCTSLAEVHLQPTTPPTLGGDYVFPTAATIFIDNLSSTSSYQTAWSGNTCVSQIADVVGGTCGESATWRFYNGTLTISGSGRMTNFANINTVPWKDKRSSISNIVIEDGITSIGAYSFYNCSTAVSIRIPASVDSIANNAFYNCKFTDKVYYEGTLAQWCAVQMNGSTANPFYYQYSGSSAAPKFRINGVEQSVLNIPEGVSKIGSYCFYGLTNITSVTIPTSVATIGQRAFYNCTGLATLIFSETATLETIETYAFYGNTALTSLTLPASIKVIEERAFSGCSAITTIDFSKATKLTQIGSYAFFKTSALTAIDLRNLSELTTIGNYAFSAGTSDNTTTVGFLYFPNKVASIGNYAFNYRKGITGIVIMNTSTSIITATSTSFSNFTTTIPVYVNSEPVATAYKSATGWSGFTNYVFDNTIEFECGSPTLSDLTAKLDVRTGALTFTGSGAMKNFTTSSRPGWYSYQSVLKSVTFGNVTAIGNYAFDGCSGLIGTITITNKITSIGNYAFRNCTGIPGLTFNNTTALTTIGNYAFSGCSSITSSIKLPASITSLGTYAFSTCKQLSGVTFEDGWQLASLPNYLFNNCYNLSGTIAIPEAVTTIGSNAFANCSTAVSLNLSRATALTTINDRAFAGCTGLDGTIVFPASMTTIGTYAFNNCSSIDEIIILKTSGTITASSDYTFNNMASDIPVRVATASLKNTYASATGWKHFTDISVGLTVTGQCGDNLQYSLSLSDGSMSITGTGAMWDFNNSSNPAPWKLKNLNTLITSVSIASTVETIGNYAFDGCSNVTVFDFVYDSNGHNSLISIGEYAFLSCSGASFNSLWGSWSDNLESVGKHAFEDCAMIRSVVVPRNITFMGDWVFKGCSALSSVTWNAINYTSTNISQTINPFYGNRSTITSFVFGPEVEIIPKYLCYKMTALTTISFPSSVREINEGAFYGCNRIAGTLTIPNTISLIGNSVFRECTALTSLLFESTCQLTEISDYAFYGCSNLTLGSASFPASVTSIGNYAFYQCTHITSLSFSTTSRVTSIGNRAFYGCVGLTSVTFGESSRVESIGDYAFYGCNEISNSGMKLPSGLRSLGDYVFYGCTKIKGIMYVNCPSLTAIPNNAFTNCSSLTGLDLTGATSLTTIGNNAFSGCANIKGEIYIPSTITSIGTKAFWNCSAVESMYVEPTTVPAATSSTTTGTFQGMTSTIPVRVPADMVSAYQSAAGWEYFDNIQAFAAGQCGDDLYWKINYNTNTLVITGIGAMYDYGASTNQAPWISYKTYWSKISFPEQITTIGNYAFYNCANLIGSITFTANLVSIGTRAFYGCTEIKGLDFNKAGSLTNIGAYSFYNCKNSSFTTLTLPTALSTIGQAAFGLCSSLTTVTIPENVTSMNCSSGNYTFVSCPNITTVNWNAIACSDFTLTGGQSGVTYYTPWGLSKSSITKFNIGSNVRIIPKYLCQGLTSITTISLGDSIREIHEGAFLGCSALTAVTLPQNLTTLESSAFKNCSGISTLDMSHSSSLSTIGISAFEGCSAVDGVLYIPENVTSIGSNAFKNFSLVDTIYAIPATPPTAYSSTFTNMVKTIPVVVADNDIKALYQAATGWEEFTNYVIITFSGQCGDNLYWALNPASGILNITGTGAMWDFNYTSTNLSPWYSFRNLVHEVFVAEGATYLGNYAFRECKDMRYISLPASITSMSASVFSITPKLKDYSYAGTLQQWLAIDFLGNSGNPLYCTQGKLNIEGEYITELVIPEGCTKVKKFQFTKCKGLTSLVLPSTLAELESNAFYDCVGLTDIYIYALNPPILPSSNGAVFSTTLIKSTVLHTMCAEVESLYKTLTSYSDHWGKFTHFEYMNDYCVEIVVSTDSDMSDIINTELPVNIRVEPEVILTMDDVVGAININDIILEPTSHVSLLSNATYSINNLIVQRRGDETNDEVATADLQGSMTAQNLILDFTLDNSRWFAFSLPQSVAASSVTYSDGTALRPDVDYYAMYFNGESRATNGYSASGDNWRWLTGGDIVAHRGYLLGLPDGVSEKTLRFTMQNPNLTQTEDKNITVSEYASQVASNAGWNMIGNPYLQPYQNSETQMQIGDEDLMSVMTFAVSGEHLSYTSELVNDVEWQPFSAMFIQAPATGSLVFDHSSARRSIVSRRQGEKTPTNSLRLELANTQAKDRMTFITGDFENSEYRIGVDMAKWFNDSYKTQPAPTLYSMKGNINMTMHALGKDELHDIPIGIFAPRADDYLFSISHDDSFGQVLLYDALADVVTDLKTTAYPFYLYAGSCSDRFFISATLKNDEQDTPTYMENTEQKVKIITEGLSIRLLNLPQTTITIFDTTGKQVTKQFVTTDTKVMLPQSGMYLVSYEDNGNPQTLRCIVK